MNMDKNAMIGTDGEDLIMSTSFNGNIILDTNLLIFETNDEAILGGLLKGTLYINSLGDLRVVF